MNKSYWRKVNIKITEAGLELDRSELNEIDLLYKKLKKQKKDNKVKFYCRIYYWIKNKGNKNGKK